MSEKKIVIVSDRLMYNIDKYRGQLSRAEFVRECIERLLCEPETEREAPLREKRYAEPEVRGGSVEYVTRREFEQFKSNMGKLQQEFMDFFIKYGKQLAGEGLSKEDAERFTDELRRLLQL